MKATRILKSTAIFTAKEETPFAGFVAVAGKEILAVEKGDDYSAYADDGTEVIDCGDKLIMPAFVDAHVHFFEGVLTSSEHMCNLEASTSEEDAVERMKTYQATHPAEKALRGFGWFPATWGTEELPTKVSLDAAFPDIPVYCVAADWHTIWCNSKALEVSGYTADYQPPSGSIGLDENGELNGLLFEPEAYDMAMQQIKDYPIEELKRVMKEFIDQLQAYGITAVSDMFGGDFAKGGRRDLEAAHELDQEGKLGTRLHIFHKFIGYRDFTPVRELANEIDSPRLKISGGKAFVDGVSTTYTALLNEPYADRPDTCGIGVPITPKEEMEASAVACNAAGFPVRFHADGDGASRMALDIFEASIEANGKHHLPNSIEHIETIAPSDIPRFRDLEVIASMQPLHMVLDENEKVARCGEERCKYEWAHRTFLDTDVTLAFGSDYPVVHFNPFPNIHAAVTRCDGDGRPTGVNPEQKISLAESLTAYTLGAAKCYMREAELGSLEAGKLADIVVVDRNLFAVSEQEIHDAAVAMTLMDGEIVCRK